MLFTLPQPCPELTFTYSFMHQFAQAFNAYGFYFDCCSLYSALGTQHSALGTRCFVMKPYLIRYLIDGPVKVPAIIALNWFDGRPLSNSTETKQLQSRAQLLLALLICVAPATLCSSCCDSLQSGYSIVGAVRKSLANWFLLLLCRLRVGCKGIYELCGGRAGGR